MNIYIKLIFIVLGSLFLMYNIFNIVNYRSEAFSNIHDSTENLEDSFCRYHDSHNSAVELNNSCSRLTHNNCLKTTCCVWGTHGNKSQCVAGNERGTTFKTDNEGNNIEIDSYYHLDKCYGNCII
jgi:hypothetical protein